MMKRLLLGVAAATLGFIALVVAQITPIYNWLGTETFRITLGSGSSVTIDLNTVRNTVGVSPIGAGTTVAVSPTGAVGYLVGTGAITNYDSSLPYPANQGQLFCISNGTGSSFTTNTTVAANPSTSPQTHTLNTTFTKQTLGAGASACWTFNFNVGSSTVGTWFRVR